MAIEFLPQQIPETLNTIALEIEEIGGSCYLVGGWVRDAILGVKSKDYDIEVYGVNEEQLLSILGRHGRPNLVGRAFGVFLMNINRTDFEFAFPRTEKKTGKGHTAFEVTSDPSLDFVTASKRRDFTINSMGLRLPECTLIDPNNGQNDLQARVLRHVSDAFSEDPLRALRAVQFAARFDLVVDEKTVALCAQQDLSELSSERFYEEFKKLLFKSKKPSIGLRYLKKMDLLRYFPELNTFRGTGECWDLLLTTVDCAAKERGKESKTEEIFMLSALCSHMEQQKVDQFLKRMTRDSKLIQGVKTLTSCYAMILEGNRERNIVNEGWVKRLALKAPLVELERVARCVETSKMEIQKSVDLSWLKQIADRFNVWHQPPEPYLTGKDLISFGVPQGPIMGEIIKESFELQLDGDIKSRAEAIDWAKAQI